MGKCKYNLTLAATDKDSRRNKIGQSHKELFTGIATMGLNPKRFSFNSSTIKYPFLLPFYLLHSDPNLSSLELFL